MAEKKKRRAPKKHAEFPAELQRSYKARGASGSFATQPQEFAFEYTTPGPYCQVDRLKKGRCATQFNFVKGQPVIRLCGKYGDPGKVIPVSGPAEAQQKAQAHCAVFSPGLEEAAATERPPAGKRLNPAWLAAGIAMGVMTATLLKRRQAAGTPA